jgi:hypothetical protein
MNEIESLFITICIQHDDSLFKFLYFDSLLLLSHLVFELLLLIPLDSKSDFVESLNEEKLIMFMILFKENIKIDKPI